MHRPASLNGNGRPHHGFRPVQVVPLPEFMELQRGIPLVAAITLSAFTTLSNTWINGPHFLTNLILLPQLFSLVCFCTLLVRVQDDHLFWQYGPGWIRRVLPLSQIESTRIVTTPFAYGWGIRRTAQGWRFNRLGALAVEIQCRDGRRLRLGTPRAHELHVILNNRRLCP